MYQIVYIRRNIKFLNKLATSLDSFIYIHQNKLSSKWDRGAVCHRRFKYDFLFISCYTRKNPNCYIDYLKTFQSFSPVICKLVHLHPLSQFLNCWYGTPHLIVDQGYLLYWKKQTCLFAVGRQEVIVHTSYLLFSITSNDKSVSVYFDVVS